MNHIENESGEEENFQPRLEQQYQQIYWEEKAKEKARLDAELEAQEIRYQMEMKYKIEAEQVRREKAIEEFDRNKNKILSVISWIATVLMGLLGIGCVTPPYDDIPFFIWGISCFLVGIVVCPVFNRFMGRFKTYTKYKPFIMWAAVILCVVLCFT